MINAASIFLLPMFYFGAVSIGSVAVLDDDRVGERCLGSSGTGGLWRGPVRGWIVSYESVLCF